MLEVFSRKRWQSVEVKSNGCRRAKLTVVAVLTDGRVMLEFEHDKSEVAVTEAWQRLEVDDVDFEVKLTEKAVEDASLAFKPLSEVGFAAC